MTSLYEHIDRVIAAVIRFSADDVLARWSDELPAEVASFTDSAAFLRGSSAAQVASAFISAAFATVLAVAIARRRALATAAPVPEAAPGTPAAVPAAAIGPLRARWDEVAGHLDSTHESDWKVALLKADTLADEALARAGFPGDTFGDRLTNIAPGTLRSLDGLWWAHKVRNRLAHESDYFLRYTEAKQAVAYYEQALAELQLL